MPSLSDLEPIIHAFGALIAIVLFGGLLAWAVGALVIIQICRYSF